jgi:hypothetical protein
MAQEKRPTHHCGMCGQLFTSKADLNIHTQYHEDNETPQLFCQVCSWTFKDSLALEAHKLQTGHGFAQYSCEKIFNTPRGLDNYMGPQGLSKAFTSTSTSQMPLAPIQCDRCTTTFETRREYNKHRSYKTDGPCADHNHKTPPKDRVGYVDPDKPKERMQKILVYASSDVQDNNASDGDSGTPTDLSDGEEWCHQCKNKFDSKAKYNAHVLRCSTKHGLLDNAQIVPGSKASPVATKTTEVIQPPTFPAQQHNSQTILNSASNGTRSVTKHPRLQTQLTAQNMALLQNARPAPPATPSATASAAIFACDVKGCQRTYQSEGGLKVHKMYAHGIGGKKVDLLGKDSWMLTQRMREQLKAQGIFQPPRDPSKGRDGEGRGRASRALPLAARLPPASRSARPPQQRSKQHHITPAPIPAFGYQFHLPVRASPASTLLPAIPPTSQNLGGAFEVEQAKYIQGKILRLLIQSDIFIHNDGMITVCEINWTRIGVQKQPEVIGMFDGMCHLPKIVQGEYLPPPKAFSDEYKSQYPASEFEPSPPRDCTKPGLGVVALSCSKIVLANGLQEVVKIAAIDLVTCRILMNHFVCTDSEAQVSNWRSNDTGLFSWDDMRHAQKSGFKVFKGWSATRSALWKFVDKDTIVVGHNLRSDLDALRMVHGRAVDIAKVAEKAANGPLSKVQLGLDSLCRNYPAAILKSDPEYGRDVLMNAFAAREMGLWVIKNKDRFDRDIQQKSVEYQVVMPRVSAV